MSKPVHPIRRLGAALYPAYAEGFEGSTRTAEERITNRNRIIAHHVRPLLDALERDGHGVDERGDCLHIGGCADCRLLARWEAKP